MKKALLAVLALGALLGVSRPSNAAFVGNSQPFTPIVQIYLKNWNTTSARYYVQLANIGDLCGVGSALGYFDPGTPNSSEMYKILDAAFLSGRLVSLALTAHTSSCEITGIQVQS